jgi:hypothetical protein
MERKSPVFYSQIAFNVTLWELLASGRDAPSKFVVALLIPGCTFNSFNSNALGPLNPCISVD